MRAVLNKRCTENVGNMLKEMGYFRIAIEIQGDVLIFIFRPENGLLLGYLDGMLTRNREIHNYETRQAKQFHVDKSNSEKADRM